MPNYRDSYEPDRLDPTDPDLEPNTLIIVDQSLRLGFIQLPKLILYARNISRDAKLLYGVLLGYAWQEQRCFPGYQRLCLDMGASENAVRKYMRELEAVGLLQQRRRGQGKTNVYILTDIRTAKIEVQEPQQSRTAKSEVQDHVKSAGLVPQELRGEVETEKIEAEEKQSALNSNGIPLPSLHKISKDLYSKTKQIRARSTVDNSAVEDGHERPLVPTGFAAVGDLLAQRTARAPASHHATPASRRGRPPKAPPFIARVMTDISAQLHDDERSMQGSLTHATRLWRDSGLSEPDFVHQVLYPAWSTTKQQGNIHKEAELGHGLRNKVPYFFAVVQDLLGLKDEGSTLPEPGADRA